MRLFGPEPAAEQPADLADHAAGMRVLAVAQPAPAMGEADITHRLVKARKVRSAHQRLRARLMAYHEGGISFAELDAGIRGWINHVRYANSWGLRRHVLETLVIRPAEHRTNRRAALARRPSALRVR